MTTYAVRKSALEKETTYALVDDGLEILSECKETRRVLFLDIPRGQPPIPNDKLTAIVNASGIGTIMPPIANVLTAAVPAL